MPRKKKTKNPRGKDPESADSKYPKRFTVQTTPEVLVFLQTMKRLTGARNVQNVVNDAFKVYHRECRAQGYTGIPPLTRRKKTDGT